MQCVLYKRCSRKDVEAYNVLALSEDTSRASAAQASVLGV